MQRLSLIFAPLALSSLFASASLAGGLAAGALLTGSVLISALLPRAASAQVVIVEEREVEEEQVVERGYVRGQGRGIQYGAHLISPVYLTDVTRAGTDGVDPADRLRVGPGAGLHGRIGWEFPSGLTLELFGGFAANGVDTQGLTDVSNVFLRIDLGGGLRYLFFNESALVPFVGIGVQGSWFKFDWSSTDASGREVDLTGTFGLHAVLGLQIELSPYFGIEVGCAVDYMFGLDLFGGAGLVGLRPFIGVTLYVYDEND